MKSVKNIIVGSLLLSLLVIFNACEPDAIGQYPIDAIAPQPVSNVRVDNLPGAIRLSYDLPDEEDLLYVKAIYPLENGEIRVAKTSVFSNTMYIKGFGKSKKQLIKLIAVDGSQNESAPVEIEINPLDAPIYTIIENLKASSTWGGFKMVWENPFKEDIVLEVLRKNPVTGEFSHIESIYSSEINAEKAVRGLDSTLTTFGIFIRDIYYNYTDTLEVEIKPLFEELVPKTGFKGFPLSTQFKQHSAFGGGMIQMWDDITNVRENCYYIMTGNVNMPYFTIDMGIKAKFSRFRIWQRIDYMFALHNPKGMIWYGTNDYNAANDNESPGWQDNPAWIKLGDFESKRPSGGKSGDPITSEDQAYALAGEEFEFPIEVPSVRYIRFQLVSTWSGSSGLHINELAFWGLIEK
jgi:hypothetical protein